MGPRSGDEASSPSLAVRIQRRLMHLYGVDAPCIDDFIQPSDDGRERLEVRETADALEIAVLLPVEALGEVEAVSLDVYCQVAEGVSHFLYLIERVRRALPATQLELELQAEVDKYVMVTGVTRQPSHGPSRVRQRLFEGSNFLHPEGSERGDRYRFANQLASRFVRCLPPDLMRSREEISVRTLRRFFDAGQREKIEMALAA